MGKKHILSIGFIVLFSALVHAQAGRGNYNFMDFQQKPYYFGITLGINTANYSIFQSRDFIGNTNFNTIESVLGSGGNFGIVTNLKIGKYFDVRFLPTLSFATRNIRYIRPGEEIFQRKIESVFAEMPFHIRYKSAPFNDTRLFVIGGIKYSFDVASESRAVIKDVELVKVSPTDFALEIGGGIQFFFPYFIFSPEIKFSHGLGNTLIYNENLEESQIIDKILSRTFTISLHFEG
jgi:hypothetical protein